MRPITALSHPKIGRAVSIMEDPMKTHSSEDIVPAAEVADVLELSKVIGKPSKKDNPFTPKFRSPAESQIVNAIMEANTECRREWLKDVLEPYQWKIIKALGEYDEDGDPGKEMLKCGVALLIASWSIKVDGNDSDVLTTLMGAESTHFSHCSKQCDVRLAT